MSVKILGTGSFLPEKSVSNDDLSKVMDTSDEWISSRTGIRSRHISIEDTTSTMAVKAAKKALENAGVSAEELDHIFVATLSGDHATPSTSCQVQKGIGAVNAVCMDINAACSAFDFLLETAHIRNILRMHFKAGSKGHIDHGDILLPISSMEGTFLPCGSYAAWKSDV